MMGTMSLRQPENWLYEIWQKGYDSPCYVMVPNAKDLVKSHLMIAVREEVEVLKERISELMEKINKLELENNILKSNMSQETLQQLQIQLQIAGSQQPAAVAAPPTTPAIQAAPAAATAATAAATVPATTAATSPANAVAAVAPLTIATNGSSSNSVAENINGEATAAVAANNTNGTTVQVAAAVAAAPNAGAVVDTNGPMS